VAEKLAGVGLAELQEYGYVRLDPALPAYLRMGQAPERLAELEAVWAEAMTQLVDLLYQQRFKDTTMAARLTLLELPNLLALLGRLEQQVEADNSVAKQVAGTARYIEQLLEYLNRPQALAKAVEVRQRAITAIPEWGHARFENERLEIERLLQQGQFQPALNKARALLEKARTAGPAAYKGADYDLALAHWLLGRVLLLSGQAGPALDLLLEAQRLFEELRERGERMASVTLTEQADCLTALGRLDEAARVHQEQIKRSEGLQDFRAVAVGKMQLATVRYLQGKYAEAIDGYEEARVIFERLNEPGTVAVAWHQIAMVHQETGDYDAAEDAYRRSLEICTQTKDRNGQADNLLQLGNLYGGCLNRPEQAVAFYRQAADIYVKLGNRIREGCCRNNIALTLSKLKRYEEARREIMRAIECGGEYGHVAEPWRSFSILHDIETAAGNQKAAREAWRKARDNYLAYRQQGGYAQYGGGKVVDRILGLISEGKAGEIQPLFEQLANNPNATDSIKHLMQAVIAVLGGSRDPALAENSALDYDDAAEVLFLIERLEKAAENTQ
jgi:tetratricopeptide (TPR) repeat protein